MSTTSQLITTFCEGPHDVAFINRILKCIGYKSYDACKIGELPIPFNQLILQEAKKSNIENLNLIELRRGFLPSKVMVKDNNFIFLYSIGGDSKKEIREKMLQDLLSFVPSPGEISSIPENTELSVVYLFDADQKGVQKRIEELNNEISNGFNNKISSEFKTNASFQTLASIKLGVFVFTGDDNNQGTLEDILIPLMCKDNESIFDEAMSFIDTNHKEERLYPLKVQKQDDLITEKRSERKRDMFKFQYEKSLIGTVGQLQCSGKSNVVCINDSDYLTLDKIKSNAKCIEILDFLNKI